MTARGRYNREGRSEMSIRRTILIGQLLATLAVLAVVPGNAVKTVSLLALWLVTFYPVGRRELVFYLGVCTLFSVMDVVTLRQGIFRFTNADVLGMPMFEFFMWGFYLLHVTRFVSGPSPPNRKAASWGLTAAFCIAFSILHEPVALLAVSGGLLVVGLILFHEPLDFAYVGYTVLVGALVEYTGVWSGQWAYPGAPWGGVPPWFITLWGGVGLILRSTMLPILAPAPRSSLRDASSGAA